MEKTGTELTNELLKQLVENTTGPNDPDVATTDENLNINGIFQETLMPSLARNAFGIAKMSGPTAALFNIKNKDDNSGVSLVRKEVEVFPSEAISTGITRETVQDLVAQYGENAKDIIGKLLRGLANEQENEKTLTFLDTESATSPTLTLSEPDNARTVLFEISKKVGSLIMSANTPKYINYSGYCILPASVSSVVLTLSKYLGGEETNTSDLYLGESGKIKFYLNPDPNSTDAYVGICNKENISECSSVFSPYVETVVEATDSDTGEETFHIYNRFALTSSPLHDKANRPLMFKFTIA